MRQRVIILDSQNADTEQAVVSWKSAPFALSLALQLRPKGRVLRPVVCKTYKHELWIAKYAVLTPEAIKPGRRKQILIGQADQNDGAKRRKFYDKLQLCAMSIVHVYVGWVTESLPRNDAYALIIVKLFFIKFLGHATLVRRPPHLLLRPWVLNTSCRCRGGYNLHTHQCTCSRTSRTSHFQQL